MGSTTRHWARGSTVILKVGLEICLNSAPPFRHLIGKAFTLMLRLGASNTPVAAEEKVCIRVQNNFAGVTATTIYMPTTTR